MKRILLVVCVVIILAFLLTPVYVSRTYRNVIVHHEELVHDAFMMLQQGEMSQFIEQLTPDALEIPDLWTHVDAIHQQIPREPFTAHRLVTWQSSWQAEGTNSFLMLEYTYPTTVILVQAYVVEKDGLIKIRDLILNRDVQGLRDVHAFTLRDKSLIHYIVLVLAVLIPLTCIFAFIQCIRTPMLKRKWLWIAGTLIGFGTISLDWTTGWILFKPLTLQLLGAGFVNSAPGYAPWVISISLPIGAILFLLRRKALLEAWELAQFVQESEATATPMAPPVE